MKKVICCIMLLVAGQYCFAEDYLVSSVQEATAMLKKAKAGDRVLLKNGTYNNEKIKFENTNGTPNLPVVFAAETPGNVFFEKNSSLSVSGKHVTVTGFTWRNGGSDLGKTSVIELRTAFGKFSDCAIVAYNSVDTIDNKWVSIYGEYNTVSNCLFKDKRNLGATLTVWLTPGTAAHHTISHNYFLGRQNGPNQDNGLESIRIGDSKTSFENAHCVVALNRFEDCDGEIEIISNKSCYNSYLHNTFYKSDGGLTLRHGNNCLVDGNVFDGAGKPLAYGVRFIGEGHAAINNYFYNLPSPKRETFRAPLSLVTGVVNTAINGYFQVRRAYIASNLFVNSGTPHIRVGATPKREGAVLAPDTVKIANNLFFSDTVGGGSVYEEVLSPENATIANNVVIGKKLEAGKSGFTKTALQVRRNGILLVTDNKDQQAAKLMGKAALPKDIKAGANQVSDSIINAISGIKFTIVGVAQVGPSWTHSKQ
ncbi:hypothetical protein EXU57_00665 [Segetibacter sp. 3557_3]|uniref:polysaccharide lyase 6 family protein n=1 Tax=Segetibacter sp. 3557_3 TaxID=2547429 RepID=UPI001058E3A8|nr:polysaccharide lyase 6 family protein [Segetibacter sp. 3557_3]TDH28622.1 hypothetical protein EXU57_00665 [Segetibacter sp. 3557_3]